MKAIRLTTGMDLILANRTEDFEQGVVAYYLRTRVQYGTLYTAEKVAEQREYCITLQREADAAAFAALQGVSVDQFVAAVKAQYDQYQLEQPFVEHLRPMFDDIAGRVTGVVDV